MVILLTTSMIKLKRHCDFGSVQCTQHKIERSDFLSVFDKSQIKSAICQKTWSAIPLQVVFWS